METKSGWYIIKTNSGICEIVSSDDFDQNQNHDDQAVWGPFPERNEAIAKRVGLIRAGKCQPII